jgi:hypothetical protein
MASDCESRQALDEPERGQGSDYIGRSEKRAAFDDWRRLEASGGCQYPENGSDKNELPHLYADVEREQRERNVTLR